MNLLIGICALVLAFVTCVAGQGRQYYARSFDDELRPKIVGGEEAGQIVPYQISLQVKRRPGKKFNSADWAHNCGGSILKPTVILTAAHCVTR